MAASRSKKKEPAKDEAENSILSQLMQEQQQQSVEDQFSSDVSVLFCGMKRSGKTCVIDRFINPKKDEKDVPKPTVALDYKYARKDVADNSTAKMLAHIYEIGGEEGSENLVPIVVSPRTVGNLVLCLVLDLSEPHGVLPALEKWIALLRSEVAKSGEALSKESEGGAKRMEALKQARREAYQDNPDAAAVRLLDCPLVIFGTKWDVLASTAEPEKRKSLCRALRYFAHVNGASLIFASPLKEKDTMNSVRAILRKLVFNSDTKGGVPEQLDHSKPLSVQAGRDSIDAIGKPHGSTSMEDSWRSLIATYFPDPGGQGKDRAAQKVDEELKKPEFAESIIDGMVAQRTMELDLYRRQVERNQRLASEGVESAKLAMA